MMTPGVSKVSTKLWRTGAAYRLGPKFTLAAPLTSAHSAGTDTVIDPESSLIETYSS